MIPCTMVDELQTENSKLNFFFGIYDSGKSFLIGALTRECKFEDVVISVDGNCPNLNSY